MLGLVAWGLVLAAMSALGDTVSVLPQDSVVGLVNAHTDSVVAAAADSVSETVQAVGDEKGVGLGWKIIAGILIAAEVVLRVIPTKNGATLLGIVSWLHELLPNNVKKEKKGGA